MQPCWGVPLYGGPPVAAVFVHTTASVWLSVYHARADALTIFMLCPMSSCTSARYTMLYCLLPEATRSLSGIRQADAVAATEELVRTSLPDLVAQPVVPVVEYVRRSHESFHGLGLAPGSVGVIAYNLGYLPGENVDRTVVTTAHTTVASLTAATELVRVGGLITVVCYCGHEGGAEEETAVTTWAAGLPKDRWSSLAMTWLNRENSPSLLLVERTR